MNNTSDDELQTASPAQCKILPKQNHTGIADSINPFLSIQQAYGKEEIKQPLLEENPPQRAAGSSKIISSPNFALLAKTKQKSKTGNPLLSKLAGLDSITDTHSEMGRDKLSAHSRKTSIKSNPDLMQKNSFNTSNSCEEPKGNKSLTSTTKRSAGLAKKPDDCKSKKLEVTGVFGPDLMSTGSNIKMLTHTDESTLNNSQDLKIIDFKEKYAKRCCLVT